MPKAVVSNTVAERILLSLLRLPKGIYDFDPQRDRMSGMPFAGFFDFGDCIARFKTPVTPLVFCHFPDCARYPVLGSAAIRYAQHSLQVCLSDASKNS
jgi:hypothetical protein